MRNAFIVPTLGFCFLWASTVSAGECGILHCGFAFPFGGGYFFPVFFSAGTHLGLGPGYPGIQPPLSAFNYYGFYPGRHRLPLRSPSITVYTIRPLYRFHGSQRKIPSGPIAIHIAPDQPGPAQAVVGRDFQRPAPGLDEEPDGSVQLDHYVPRWCYRGECYEINPEEALSPDAPPGIILWEPKN